MKNKDTLIPVIKDDIQLSEDDVKAKMIMCESKMDKYLERLAQQERYDYLDEKLFDNFFEIMFQDGVSKENLKNVIDNYDIYTGYHMLFQVFGDDMSKEEYIELKNRYIKTFDLETIPLPECCEKIAKKWGVKNV